MDIELKEICVRELIDNYQDNAENGVTAYNGKLDVRPAYQREFVMGKKREMLLFIQLNKAFR